MRGSRVVKTPEEFEEVSWDYFDTCKADGVKITVTGLALALGFCSRQSIYDYSKKEGFSEAVSRALLMVENGYELRLDGASVTGPIFALKNMGWSDKTEMALSGNVSHKDESEAVLVALKNKHTLAPE